MQPLNLDRYRPLARGLTLAGLALLCPAAAQEAEPPLEAESPIPKGYTLSRYEPMWKRSPFTLATPTETGEASNVGFTQSLTLNGLLTVGGVTYATVSTTEGKRFLVGPQALESSDNIRLVGVKSEQDGMVRVVTLAKGSETGTVKLTLQDPGGGNAAAPTGSPALFNNAQPRPPGPGMNSGIPNSPDVVSPRVQRRRPGIIVPTSPQ